MSTTASGLTTSFNGAGPMPLCHIDEIPDPGAKGFEVGDKHVFVVKRDGELFVYLNSCPHIGIPLEFLPDDFLDGDQRYILCANHGALFEIADGMCISGPCHGQALAAVPFRLNNDIIEIGDIPDGF